jgi:hypothetical protein
MRNRSPAVTEDEVLQYLYARINGATIKELWAAFPGKRFPSNMLFELVDAGKLTLDRVELPVKMDDPWDFRYRLSYEAWVTLTHAAALAERSADTSGTE